MIATEPLAERHLRLPPLRPARLRLLAADAGRPDPRRRLPRLGAPGRVHDRRGDDARRSRARSKSFVADLVGRPLRVDYRWAGLFGLVLDFLPVVGRVPGEERVWVAGGYSGHGNVLGLLCGELVARGDARARGARARPVRSGAAALALVRSRRGRLSSVWKSENALPSVSLQRANQPIPRDRLLLVGRAAGARRPSRASRRCRRSPCRRSGRCRPRRTGRSRRRAPRPRVIRYTNGSVHAAERPAEHAAPEALRPIDVGRGQLEVHDGCHGRSLPGRIARSRLPIEGGLEMSVIVTLRRARRPAGDGAHRRGRIPRRLQAIVEAAKSHGLIAHRFYGSGGQDHGDRRVAGRGELPAVLRGARSRRSGR